MAVCLCFGAEARIKIVPKEKFESVNFPRPSEDASFIKFDNTHIVAEYMSEDDGVQTFSYPFTNVGQDTLRIKRLVSTCSCASASCDVRDVAPGKTSRVIVRYNPKGHPGRFERKVFVYTASGDAPAAVLRLSVEVGTGQDWSLRYPVSMGRIRMVCPEVVFKADRNGVERRAFVNVGESPVELKCDSMMLPECLAFRTEPAVVGPGEEGDIIVSYDPAKKGNKDRMQIVLKGLGVPPGQSVISVLVN